MIQAAANSKCLPGPNRQALVDLLYQLADDELVVGHRSSEWLGLAPDIEEDVAFASLAQDEVGHALFFYGLLQELGEGEADVMAFDRSVHLRRNAQFVEAENDDWATNIVRRYFYETFDHVRLQSLLSSSYEPLVQGVIKILREEHYHLLHLKMWFKRLAMAKGEARTRLTNAVERLWPTLSDLFDIGVYADTMGDSALFASSSDDLLSAWTRMVRPTFEEVSLPWPGDVSGCGASGRSGQHTPALDRLLDTMGEVHRLDRTAKW